MNTKTFEAIDKLKEIELELHRLKNALEMANKALDAQRTWVGLTDEDLEAEFGFIDELLRDTCYRTETKLKEKNVL